MNLNLTLISGEEMRAASAFITLLADIREGNTKDGNILSAIMSKGLDHVKDEAPVAMAAPVGEVVEQPVKEAVKRPRKPKVEEPVVKVDGEIVEATVEGKTVTFKDAPTIDDVRAALQRFTAVHGMPEGIALLRNYGAGRISELTEEQFPLFIAECDAKDES